MSDSITFPLFIIIYFVLFLFKNSVSFFVLTFKYIANTCFNMKSKLLNSFDELTDNVDNRDLLEMGVLDDDGNYIIGFTNIERTYWLNGKTGEIVGFFDALDECKKVMRYTKREEPYFVCNDGKTEYSIETLKGHKTRAPSKKQCSIRVNVRKMF